MLDHLHVDQDITVDVAAFADAIAELIERLSQQGQETEETA